MPALDIDRRRAQRRLTVWPPRCHPDPKSRAFSGRAVELDPAADGAHRLMNQGQADAAAAVRGLIRCGAVEAMKDQRLLLLLDPGAGIGDFQHHAGRVRQHADRDRTAIGRELDRVGDQVEQDALDCFARAVAVPGAAGIADQALAVMLGDRPECIDGLRDHRVQAPGRLAGPGFGQAQPGQVEQLLDQPQQAIDVASPHLGGGGVGCQLELVDAGSNQRQRGSELVRNVGEHERSGLE